MPHKQATTSLTGLAPILSASKKTDDGDGDDDEYDIPEEIESVIHSLLTALSDKDTIVRSV